MPGAINTFVIVASFNLVLALHTTERRLEHKGTSINSDVDFDRSSFALALEALTLVPVEYIDVSTVLPTDAAGNHEFVVLCTLFISLAQEAGDGRYELPSHSSILRTLSNLGAQGLQQLLSPEMVDAGFRILSVDVRTESRTIFGAPPSPEPTASSPPILPLLGSGMAALKEDQEAAPMLQPGEVELICGFLASYILPLLLVAGLYYCRHQSTAKTRYARPRHRGPHLQLRKRTVLRAHIQDVGPQAGFDEKEMKSPLPQALPVRSLDREITQTPQPSVTPLRGRLRLSKRRSTASMTRTARSGTLVDADPRFEAPWFDITTAATLHNPSSLSSPLTPLSNAATALDTPSSTNRRARAHLQLRRTPQRRCDSARTQGADQASWADLSTSRVPCVLAHTPDEMQCATPPTGDDRRPHTSGVRPLGSTVSVAAQIRQRRAACSSNSSGTLTKKADASPPYATPLSTEAGTSATARYVPTGAASSQQAWLAAAMGAVALEEERAGMPVNVQLDWLSEEILREQARGESSSDGAPSQINHNVSTHSTPSQSSIQKSFAEFPSSTLRL